MTLKIPTNTGSKCPIVSPLDLHPCNPDMSVSVFSTYVCGVFVPFVSSNCLWQFSSTCYVCVVHFSDAFYSYLFKTKCRRKKNVGDCASLLRLCMGVTVGELVGDRVLAWLCKSEFEETQHLPHSYLQEDVLLVLMALGPVLALMFY
jgi:hypothetical protein